MGEMKFNYYYGNEANQFNFYRIPKVLFTDGRFAKLSVEAKVLYGLMLDRMCLSVKNGWIDEENRVYIYFRLEEAIECLNFGKDKCVKLFSELDAKSGIGLIRRKKQGLGKPVMIYVMNFISNTTEVKTSVIEEKDNGVSDDAKTEELSNNADLTVAEVQTSEIPKSGVLKNRSQEFGISDPNNTNINNTDSNDTESILSDHDVDKKSRMVCEEKIKKNIEYEHLLEIYPKEDIDGLLNIIVDAICSKKPYLVVAGEETPKTIVTARLLNLNSNHIEYVMDSLKKNTTSIKNIKSYLLTALYNASSTIGHYYRAEVNHDFKAF